MMKTVGPTQPSAATHNNYLGALIRIARAKQASDLHVIAGLPPALRLNGEIVMLEADVAGRWSDNAFDLTAGAQKTVIFTPATSGAAPQFHWLDLHSCQTSQD